MRQCPKVMNLPFKEGIRRTDRDTRRSKGFAFIEMPEASEAKNAITELNGAEYAGRPMVVKEALPRN